MASDLQNPSPEPDRLPTEPSSTRESALKELKEKRKVLLKRRENGQIMYYVLLATCILMPLVIAVIIWKDSFTPAVLLTITYSCTPVAMIPYVNALWRTNEDDLQELDFQIDLHQYAVSLSESRAEKILRINNFQLRRYHDINLQQNRRVFSLGTICIVIGASVIGVTFYLVLFAAHELDTKIIIGVLGAIGSLLTNYIASIYLKMHAAATTNLSSFHNKLVDTHQTLFGNLVASRIEDEKLRDATLSKLALFVAGSREKGKKEEKKPGKPIRRLQSSPPTAEAADA